MSPASPLDLEISPLDLERAISRGTHVCYSTGGPHLGTVLAHEDVWIHPFRDAGVTQDSDHVRHSVKSDVTNVRLSKSNVLTTSEPQISVVMKPHGGTTRTLA